MKKIVYILPILAGIMFGSVGVFVRTLYGAGFNNATVLFARTLLAAGLLLVCILIQNPKLLKLRLQDLPWILGCGILGMLTTNVCFNISSTNLSLAFAAVLLSIAPVYTLVISKLVFGNRITVTKVLCVAMTIAGCILVSGVIGSSSGLSGSGGLMTLSAVGVIAGIISGISYGLYSIFSRKGTDSGLNPITIIFYCMVIISIVLAPFTDYAVIGNYVAAAPAGHSAFLLLHSLCVGVLPYMLITLSIRRLTPGTVTILASCEPGAAMIFGVLCYGEVPTIFSLVGLVITVVALGVLCTAKE